VSIEERFLAALRMTTQKRQDDSSMMSIPLASPFDERIIAV